MSIPTTDSWEEEFDETFGHHWKGENTRCMFEYAKPERIKAFIRQLLLQERFKDGGKLPTPSQEVLKGERNRIIYQIREEERSKDREILKDLELRASVIAEQERCRIVKMIESLRGRYDGSQEY